MPFSKPAGQRPPEIGIFVLETSGLAEGAARGGDEPKQKGSPFAHATAREPRLQRLLGPWQRLGMADVPISLPRQPAQKAVGVDVELPPDEPEAVVLDPGEHVIEDDVSAWRRTRIEALEQLAAHQVPRPPDLAVEPAPGGPQLVVEARVGALPTDEYDFVELTRRVDPAEHGSFRRTVFPEGVAAEPAAPTGSPALDDGTCKILGGHHGTSSADGPRVRVVGSRRNRSSGVLFNARLSAR